MPTLGQQITWEMPYFAKGHTALPNIAPTITGTNTGNFTLEYQINTGSGFSAWKALTGANLVTETISSVTGFKLKIRATVATANATNALTYIRIDTTTTDPAQDEQYPLDTYTLTLTGLQANSDIVIYQAGTTTIRESVDANPSTSWGYLYSAIEAVDIGIFIAGYIPFYIRNYSLTSADASIPVAQVIDRAYLP
jgi:hypothetical protein